MTIRRPGESAVPPITYALPPSTATPARDPMEIPPIEAFRQHDGTAYGPPFSVDPKGADFTLTIPEGDTMWEPHEASYRMAQLVLAELEALTKTAVHYLSGGIDFADWGITGEPYLNQVQCDARAEKITLSMSWETNIHNEWSVTFFWREREDDVPRWCWPTGFAFRNR